MPDAAQFQLPGRGSRSKSQNQRPTASASHKNIATINRGNHEAGTSQTSPKSNATKNRVPKPNGILPSPRCAARSPAAGRMAVRSSLRNLDRRQNFGDHRSAVSPSRSASGFSISRWRRTGGRGGFDVVGNQKIAALHSGKARATLKSSQSPRAGLRPAKSRANRACGEPD